MKRIFSLLLALGAVVSAQGQQFTDAARKAAERQEAAQAEYAAFLEEIGPQKAKLGADLEILEEQLRSLQQEFANASRISQTLDVEVNQLESRIKSLEDTNSYIQQTLLSEYIRRFDGMLNAPEHAKYYDSSIRPALESVETEEGVEVSDRDIFQAQLKAITASLDHVESALGGTTLPGTAVLNEEVVDGNFAVFGPLTYFASGPEKVGIVNGMASDTIYASIYPLPKFAEGIIAATSGQSASVPVDTTGTSRSGSMESLENIKATLSFTEEFFAGGFVMYFIFGLFIVAIIIAVFKFFELFGVKKAKQSDLDTVLGKLANGDYDGALSYAKGIGGPAGQMLTAAVEHADEDKEVIEEVLYETIVKTQPHLERLLSFIAVTAATAPLLGLLGTVTGMIKTFKLITIVGTGDAQSLSSGISEALITTKWGLIVAIPTLIMHALLNRKAKGVVGSLEQTGVGFINGIASIRGRAAE